MDIVIGIVVVIIIAGVYIYKNKPEWIEIIKSYWKK